MKVSLTPEGSNFILRFNAEPAAEVSGWGFAIDSHPNRILLGLDGTHGLGDLNQEWNESWRIAQGPPDLKPLDAEVKAWFEEQR